MDTVRKRIETKLERFGSTLTFNGTVQVKAFVQELLGSQISTYFEPADQPLVVRPGLSAVVRAEASVAVGDTTALDGRTYAVQRVAPQRLAGVTVCKLLILY